MLKICKEVEVMAVVVTSNPFGLHNPSRYFYTHAFLYLQFFHFVDPMHICLN
jgi:hypothetical protein